MTRLGLLAMLVATLCFGGGCDGISQPGLGPCSEQRPFCQRYQGRSWSGMTNDLTFEAAKKYCSSIGGRLPTISELRTLIVECAATRTRGSCGVTDTCASSLDCWNGKACVGCGDGGHSVFGDDPPFWSSTPVADATLGPTGTIEAGSLWTIAFRYNSIAPIQPSFPISAYCLEQ